MLCTFTYVYIFTDRPSFVLSRLMKWSEVVLARVLVFFYLTSRSHSPSVLAEWPLLPQAIFHPDTGEKIPMPFRMSGEGVSMPLTCVSVCRLAVCSLLPAQETWQNGRRTVWTERLGKVTLSWILIKVFGSCCLEMLLGLSEIGVF